MEARDSGSRIRPLPIDDLDGDAPQPPVEPRRNIAPLVAIILGALAFGVIARGLSAGGGETVGADVTTPPTTVADTTTTTTTTVPPPPLLRDMLPVAGDRLKLVALTTTAKVGHWDADLAFPSYQTSTAQPESASYNSDGSSVAISSGVGGDLVVIDRWPSSPAYIWDATSGVWHDTDASLFAWTEIDVETESTIVRVGDITGDTSGGVAALSEFRIPEPGHTLRAWGDWGFATTDGPTTFGFDPDGIQTRAVDGVYFDATTAGLLLLADPTQEGIMPFLFNPDGSRTELPSLDIGGSDFRITTDGGWVLATTVQADGHTSILARAVRSRSTRISSIEGTARIVNMTWGDRLVVLQGTDSSDLVFKNWNTGAEYRVGIDDPIAAVFIPDEFRPGE